MATTLPPPRHAGRHVRLLTALAAAARHLVRIGRHRRSGLPWRANAGRSPSATGSVPRAEIRRRRGAAPARGSGCEPAAAACFGW